MAHHANGISENSTSILKIVSIDKWKSYNCKLERKSGMLLKRMNEVLDGEALKYVVEGGDYVRKEFWGK